jgi:RNA polymerase sporulation-specific sigma factor
MPARAATAVRTQQRSQRELEDLQLLMRVRNGDDRARDELIQRYTGFVRMKASSYFIAGGEGEDLIQEGLIGLCKAVRDFRADKETSFRSFAELCVTRQIITAIKTATRFKHAPLNNYVSFSQTPAGQDPDSDCTLEGSSYEEMAELMGCDTKAIDNALQRVKRKIVTHQRSREVLA